jgi:hypothetical protein
MSAKPGGGFGLGQTRHDSTKKFRKKIDHENFTNLKHRILFHIKTFKNEFEV